MTDRLRFKKFMYFHDRTSKCEEKMFGFRNKTYASYYNEDTDELQIGVAICSPEDSFNKKVGRKLAGLRAIKKPILTLNVNPDFKPEGLLANVANMFINAR